MRVKKACRPRHREPTQEREKRELVSFSEREGGKGEALTAGPQAQRSGRDSPEGAYLLNPITLPSAKALARRIMPIVESLCFVK